MIDEKILRLWEERAEMSESRMAGNLLDAINEIRSNQKIITKLHDLCADIFAHSELDFEVTICGNGVNCSEAHAVAKGIEKIIGKTPKQLVTDKAKELEGVVLWNQIMSRAK